MDVKTIEASVLRIGTEEYGPADGYRPCIMMHGFPYDVHACRDPRRSWRSRARASSYLSRGYGGTVFLSGQNTALGRASRVRGRPIGADGCARHRPRGDRRL